MKRRERELTFPISKFDGEMILVALVTLGFDVMAVICTVFGLVHLLNGWVGAALLGFAGLFGLIGVAFTLGLLRSSRFYWLSMRKSACYVLTEASLQRVDWNGVALEEVPYANMKRVRLKTSTAMNGNAMQYIGIKVANKLDRNTHLDPYGRSYNRGWKFDVVILDANLKGPLEPLYEALQAQQRAWYQPEPAAVGPRAGRVEAADRAERRGVRPSAPEERDEDEGAGEARPWYTRPRVALFALLGFVALGGLGWLLSVVLSPKAEPGGPVPAPGQAAPPVVAQGPQQQPGQPAAVGAPAPDPGPQPQQGQPAAPQGAGPLARWSLDEGQGKILRDSVGQIPARIFGGEWVPGVKGSAVRLNGKRQYIELGVEDRLNFRRGDPFTVTVWASTQAERGVISSFRRSTSGFPVINLAVQKGCVQGFVRDDTSGFGAAKVVGGTMNDGKWHHIALVREPDGSVALFLDGTFQARAKGDSSAGPITTDLRALGSDRFVARAGKAGTPDFAGTLDEFCVFGRALDAKEIAALAAGNP